MRCSGDSSGDRAGDALGIGVGGGCSRPSSPISPLPLTGSRFWALSQSETESDGDERASVEELDVPSASGGGPGRAPVTLGPFIDRALCSPGWTRAGRGRHGVRRAAGVRRAGAAAAPTPAPAPDLDPAGSFDLGDFPPLPGLVSSGAEVADRGRAPGSAWESWCFQRCRLSQGFFVLRRRRCLQGDDPPWQVGPWCRGRTW
jgi:hypothetical protein